MQQVLADARLAAADRPPIPPAALAHTLNAPLPLPLPMGLLGSVAQQPLRTAQLLRQNFSDPFSFPPKQKTGRFRPVLSLLGGNFSLLETDFVVFGEIKFLGNIYFSLIGLEKPANHASDARLGILYRNAVSFPSGCDNLVSRF